MHRRKVLTEVQKRIIASEQKYMCAGEICKHVQLLPRTWELDHIIPLFLDGTNEFDNLQILCPNCHALKTQKELMVAARIKRDAISRPARTTRSPYFNPNHQKYLSTMGYNFVRRAISHRQ